MNNSPAATPPLPILDTDDALQAHVSTLLETALEPQLWFIAIDVNDRMLPTIVPLDGIPLYPDGDQDGQRLALLIDRFCSQASVPDPRLVAVIERPGQPLLTAADQAWARTIRLAASASNTHVRAILLCHSNGVRLVPDSDGA